MINSFATVSAEIYCVCWDEYLFFKFLLKWEFIIKNSLENSKGFKTKLKVSEEELEKYL